MAGLSIAVIPHIPTPVLTGSGFKGRLYYLGDLSADFPAPLGEDAIIAKTELIYNTCANAIVLVVLFIHGELALKFHFRYLNLIGCFLLVLAVSLSGRSVVADQTALTIHTATGAVTFQIELAVTPESRRRGLMFRESMPRNEGMLFVYENTKAVSMWMKDTLIPLDMLFISATGEIIRIEANTEPLSLRSIHSGEPVRAVLELGGGAAEEFGIQPGDRVSHEIFTSQD